jgi:hypothetical protein
MSIYTHSQPSQFNQNFPKPIIFGNPLNQNLLKKKLFTNLQEFSFQVPLRVSKTEYFRESASGVSATNVSVKVRRIEREERTKTLETKKREKKFWVR